MAATLQFGIFKMAYPSYEYSRSEYSPLVCLIKTGQSLILTNEAGLIPASEIRAEFNDRGFSHHEFRGVKVTLCFTKTTNEDSPFGCGDGPAFYKQNAISNGIMFSYLVASPISMR